MSRESAREIDGWPKRCWSFKQCWGGGLYVGGDGVCTSKRGNWMRNIASGVYFSDV